MIARSKRKAKREVDEFFKQQNGILSWVYVEGAKWERNREKDLRERKSIKIMRDVSYFEFLTEFFSKKVSKIYDSIFYNELFSQLSR